MRGARNETMKKAMAFADRTSEKDRLFLEGAYAGFVGEDRQRYEALLKELVLKYPREKWAFHNLGDLYYVKRDYVAAVDQYKKWLELDPRDTFAINHLVMATIPLRDVKKAQEYVKMREALAAPDAASLVWKAAVYRGMAELDKAIAAIKQSLEINPEALGSFGGLASLPSPGGQLSRLYALNENYDESLNWADEAVSRVSSAGEESGAFRTRGFYRYWRGEFKDALDDFSQAENMAEEVENWSEKAAAAAWKGIVCVALNEPELSRNCLMVRPMWPTLSIRSTITGWVSCMNKRERGRRREPSTRKSSPSGKPLTPASPRSPTPGGGWPGSPGARFRIWRRIAPGLSRRVRQVVPQPGRRF